MAKTKHRETKNIPACRCRPGSTEYPQMQIDTGQGRAVPCPYPMSRSRATHYVWKVQVALLKTVGRKTEWEKVKKMDSGSRKTFSNLFSRQTAPLKNTPQVTVVSRSGGVDPNKTRFPIQPGPRRGSKRGFNHVLHVSHKREF